MALTKVQAEGINLADAFVFSGAVSGTAGDNTPSFYGTLASTQSISNTTWTKLLIANKSWDTDSAFASNKFTIPSGEGGKYFIGYSIGTEATMDNEERLIGRPHVNGSALNILSNDWSPAANRDLFINQTTVINLNEDDYVELYAYQNDGSAVNITSSHTSFWGFKLRGV
tara:strand:+ start:28 stop:537 length:510 start_codon:yes stop_codon:yes gene_type:complete